VDAVKFKVEIERPILPPNHVPGARVPECVLLEIGVYETDVRDAAAVIAQFEAAKASGLERVHGRTIRSITPLVNGRAFQAGDS
jgi:hypothetical protein